MSLQRLQRKIQIRIVKQAKKIYSRNTKILISILVISGFFYALQLPAQDFQRDELTYNLGNRWHTSAHESYANNSIDDLREYSLLGLEYQPSSSDLWFLLAQSFEEEGQLHLKARLLEEAVDLNEWEHINPNNGHLELYNAYAKLGFHDYVLNSLEDEFTDEELLSMPSLLYRFAESAYFSGNIFAAQQSMILGKTRFPQDVRFQALGQILEGVPSLLSFQNYWFDFPQDSPLMDRYLDYIASVDQAKQRILLIEDYWSRGGNDPRAYGYFAEKIFFIDESSENPFEKMESIMTQFIEDYAYLDLETSYEMIKHLNGSSFALQVQNLLNESIETISYRSDIYDNINYQQSNGLIIRADYDKESDEHFEISLTYNNGYPSEMKLEFWYPSIVLKPERNFPSNEDLHNWFDNRTINALENFQGFSWNRRNIPGNAYPKLSEIDDQSYGRSKAETIIELHNEANIDVRILYKPYPFVEKVIIDDGVFQETYDLALNQTAIYPFLEQNSSFLEGKKAWTIENPPLIKDFEVISQNIKDVLSNAYLFSLKLSDDSNSSNMVEIRSFEGIPFLLREDRNQNGTFDYFEWILDDEERIASFDAQENKSYDSWYQLQGNTVEQIDSRFTSGIWEQLKLSPEEINRNWQTEGPSILDDSLMLLRPISIVF